MDYTQAPRIAVHADPTFTALLARNVSTDHRTHKIPPGARWVLVVAALHFTDGDGKFWPKLQNLADKAGVSRSVARDHLKAAGGIGLLTSIRYKRPDGFWGSNVYRWDPALIPVLSRDLAKVGVDRNKGKRQLIDNVWHVHDGEKWVEETR